MEPWGISPCSQESASCRSKKKKKNRNDPFCISKIFKNQIKITQVLHMKVQEIIPRGKLLQIRIKSAEKSWYFNLKLRKTEFTTIM
jgi:hypothetical protein